MEKGTLKQILLLTDGCSNQGEDPAQAAQFAYKQGITVNVIGILDQSESEESHGLEEVEAIALSGGGISQIVYSEALPETVQMVTRQAMNQTLQGVVNKELQQILGNNQTLEDIEPEKRGEIIEVVEELGEISDLEVVILIDTSASMHDKLEMVKEALIDLSVSMNARAGRNQFSIYTFPGNRKPIQKILNWTSKLESVSSVFPKMTSGGITPTGPALREAIVQFSRKNLLRGLRYDDKSDTEEAGY